MDKVWIVGWSGEHEDWPLGIFREKHHAIFFIAEASSLKPGGYVLTEKSWSEALTLWEDLYYAN